jgi:hypothetical protein
MDKTLLGVEMRHHPNGSFGSKAVISCHLVVLKWMTAFELHALERRSIRIGAKQTLSVGVLIRGYPYGSLDDGTIWSKCVVGPPKGIE